MKHVSLLFLYAYITVLLFYQPVLFTYFSQDDFFHFKVSQTDGSLTGFLNLFGAHSFQERGIAFYRPISREFLYHTFYNLFGLNPIPFRLLQLTLLAVNMTLVYLLMQKIFSAKTLSILTAFFFGITASNVAPLFYLAGGAQTLIATSFILLCLILYLEFLKSKIKIYYFASFITYIFALASHELSASLPIILLLLSFSLVSKKQYLHEAVRLLPFFIILSLYLYIDIHIIGFSDQEKQYQLSVGVKTFMNSLSWYFVWGLGIPEMLIDFVFPGFKLNPDLMKYWGNYFRIIFSAFFIVLATIAFSLTYLLWTKKALLFDKKFLFLLFWFPIAIFPVTFLPLHKSSYYLVPALPALWGGVWYLIFNTYRSIKLKHQRAANLFFVISFLSFLILSFTSIKLGETTYWAATRGKLAEKLVKEVKFAYPILPKGALIYFVNDPSYPYVAQDWGGTSKQAAFALNGEDAL
ncbi:hypothetical protein HY386_02720, partial [Candidatus Daviesbacteria bacterium]|nr:hypothetical protein [Candidatus Daviesbacteria bacterium]